MREEVADFLHYYRIERRLSEMTCKAYERDVRACLAFLSERGIRDLGLVRPPDLRAFLAAEAERRPALGSQTRAVAAGIGERRRVTPQTVRHVFASELLHARANLREIQELLGHKHLDSTQRYVRVTAHGLRGAIKRLRFASSGSTFRRESRTAYPKRTEGRSRGPQSL